MMAVNGLPLSRFGRIGLLCLTVLALAGCSTLLDTGRARSRESLVTQSSYGAADMLIQQSRSLISPDTPLRIGVLTDLDSPNEQTNFGRMVADQIASRFVQLGYNVTAPSGSGEPPANMANTGAPAGYLPPQAGAKPGPSVITGTYAVARDAVLVNLRIIEASSGKVVAAYDYPVALTRDVRELTRTSDEKSSFFDF